jgi:hypothetical protein
MGCCAAKETPPPPDRLPPDSPATPTEPAIEVPKPVWPAVRRLSRVHCLPGPQVADAKEEPDASLVRTADISRPLAPTGEVETIELEDRACEGPPNAASFEEERKTLLLKKKDSNLGSFGPRRKSSLAFSAAAVAAGAGMPGMMLVCDPPGFHQRTSCQRRGSQLTVTLSKREDSVGSAVPGSSDRRQISHNSDMGFAGSAGTSADVERLLTVSAAVDSTPSLTTAELLAFSFAAPKHSPTTQPPLAMLCESPLMTDVKVMLTSSDSSSFTSALAAIAVLRMGLRIPSSCSQSRLQTCAPELVLLTHSVTEVDQQVYSLLVQSSRAGAPSEALRQTVAASMPSQSSLPQTARCLIAAPGRLVGLVRKGSVSLSQLDLMIIDARSIPCPNAFASPPSSSSSSLSTSTGAAGRNAAADEGQQIATVDDDGADAHQRIDPLRIPTRDCLQLETVSVDHIRRMLLVAPLRARILMFTGADDTTARNDFVVSQLSHCTPPPRRIILVDQGAATSLAESTRHSNPFSADSQDDVLSV